MSRTQRVAMLLAAVAVAVGAYALIGSGEDAPERTAAPGGATGASAPAGQPGSRREPSRPPRPAEQRVRVRDGKPVGGPAEIEADSGDTVRFVVTADSPGTVHLHGYDVEKPVASGRPARFRFPADIEGVFEVEIEETATEIAELKVEP